MKLPEKIIDIILSLKMNKQKCYYFCLDLIILFFKAAMN